MKCSGSSLPPATYDMPPCGRWPSCAPPRSQSEANGLCGIGERSELAPVAELLERVRGAIDRRLVVVAADQHHADRQAMAHAARDLHRRVTGDVERTGVRQHFEGAL